MTGDPTQVFWQFWGSGRRCHVSSLYWTLVGTATLEDAKLITLKSVYTPISLSPGTGDTQLVGAAASWLPSMGRQRYRTLSSGHAEADSADRALGDLPR